MFNTMAKRDMVEDVRAVYGDAIADQIAESSAVTVIEIVVVDPLGCEYLLDPICKATSHS
jgi:hypothetical protein